MSVMRAAGGKVRILLSLKFCGSRALSVLVEPLDLRLIRSSCLAGCARPGRAAAIDLDQGSLDRDASRTDVHEPSGTDQRDLHAGFDDDFHPALEVDFLS